MALEEITTSREPRSEVDGKMLDDLLAVVDHVRWIGDTSARYDTREAARSAGEPYRKHLEHRLGVPVGIRTQGPFDARKASDDQPALDAGYVVAFRAKVPVAR